ncbi:hypothetical protein ACF08N_24345 [Streptomyces sp. NPDC015127]|uniref:hypothetical protein n=1 Tax=Streptomyces sp. NPDC015127 TaxID=3364939 RepID=UPI0036FC1930
MLYGDADITLRINGAVLGGAPTPSEDLHHEWKIGSTGMLRHAIAPSRRFVKASHDIVRHRGLNSDAKILILLVQGLPEGPAVERALGRHAEDMGFTPRQYQKAKKLLVQHGFLHEWQWQNDRGRWNTDQLMSNVSLTGEEADRVREGAPPSEPEPVVGEAEPRGLGDSPPVEKNEEKNPPHPPTEAQPREVVAAERVLLSLRHTHRELLLGVREAHSLAESAAEWLRRGVSAAELRQALTAGLPKGGVRSAVGFLRHRLVEKLPAPVTAAVPAVPSPGLVACEGPGEEHLFRPVGDETHCGRCRTAAAATQARPRPERVSWQTRVAEAMADG